MLSVLTEPFTHPFMQRALLASGMVAVLCSVVGCYMVLRGMAFLGDALAHGILPGVAIAYLLGANLLVGALVAALVVALGVAFISRTGAVREDTAIGILFAAALSLGVVLISSIRTYATDLTHILFGNVLGVGPGDLVVTGALTLVVLAAIAVLFRPLLIVSFDPVFAATLHIPTELVRVVLLVILALSIVVSLQTVGVALVAAMLVTPGATAYLLVRRLLPMMAVGAFLGLISAVVGLFVSYYANVASGAAIVLTATALFLVVFLFAPNRGLVWRLVKR